MRLGIWYMYTCTVWWCIRCLLAFFKTEEQATNCESEGVLDPQLKCQHSVQPIVGCGVLHVSCRPHIQAMQPVRFQWGIHFAFRLVFNLLNPTGHVMYHQFKFNNCTFCPHCIYVFCIYLRTNSDLCHLQHKLIGFYNRDEEWLLRGTNWVFNKAVCASPLKG